MNIPLAWQMPSMPELLILLVLGLLFFGKRLPEVGRSLGQGIVQFKKGLKDIEDEVNTTVNTPTPQTPPAPPANTAPQYKFDPYTGKPIEPTTPTV